MQAVDALRDTREPVTRPETPLALYRRYRPDTFADVIGQEHVTEPLQRALLNNRVNHAYLFSGPRGCGKTTSARILARALNCERGPVPVPCGECQSCRDLARGGWGSIDVIEIDAASHGGVNEARELRERAFFAPVHSRYKIYIIDEAHMVTKEGFNALLKVVEEPPPHVKFIFATTEPEKVLGTIRSRTHHYPFRLVPPKVLGGYLAQVCESEGVAVEPAVLPLVVRSGAGSVRDSLSVLDQLLGGAAEAGVTYRQATALLGYTPDALLDEIVDAFAAGDAHGVFAAIDKVIEVGQDPRRFAEDLLRRLRDLIIVAAVPDALSSGLVEVAADQADRLVSQASALGAGELTRAAEVIAVGLTEMRGTTAPRLHLELMCARVLLPGADTDGRGLHARLDRLERRLGMPNPEGTLEPNASSTPDTRPRAAAAAGQPAPDPRRTPQRPGSMPAVTPEASRPEGSPPGDFSPAGFSTAGSQQGFRPTESETGSEPGSGQPPRSKGSPESHPRSGREPQPKGSPESQRGSGREPQPTGSQPTEPWPTGSQPTEWPMGSQPTEWPTGPQPTDLPVPTRNGRTRQPAAPPPDSTASHSADRSLTRPDAAPAPSAAALGSFGTADLRRLWPDVLDEVKTRRRFTWILLSQNAQVVEVRDGTLTLGMANPGARDSFGRGGSADVLREAILRVVGVSLHIEPILDAGAATTATATAAAPGPVPMPEPEPFEPEPRSAAAQAARENLRATRSGPSAPSASEPESEPTRDDESLDEEESSDELLKKHLGAELIAEED
ncbi:MAG: DNA polymerase III subunit gamma and tau [Propionicimonas sp.]